MSTNIKWKNVNPTGCKPWLVLPTVYSDALSYGEQLDKFCYTLNQVIANNNILPDFITEMIKEYISTGVIGDAVKDILAGYILNVKYPPEGITPAVGDGTADDTEAIQGCIDYASANGGVVYFPYGSYLTQSITLKSGVSLFGFDRYRTKLVLKSGATTALLNSNNIDDVGIVNLTLDGNSGVQVNDVNVISVMAQDMLLDNLIIGDGYNLVAYSGLGGHLQINNVVFGNTVQKCFSVSGNVDVQMNNALFTQLSSVSGVSVLDIMSDGGVYDFTSTATCTNCIVISGDDNKIVARVENATNPVNDTGNRNNIEIIGVSDKQYLSGDSDVTIMGVATQSFGGTLSKQVTGVTTETYLTDKVVQGTNTSETWSGTKAINADDITLNPTNPLGYKNPEDLNRFFKYVQFKNENNTYNVLVGTEYTELLSQGLAVNVAEYDAVGDGETDDTGAFTNALADAKSKSSGLIIPPGKYKITSGLLLDWNNAFVIGLNATLITSGAITCINTPENQIKNIVVSGITIEGDGTGKGIVFNNTFTSSITNVNTSKLANSIEIYNCYGTSLINCNLYNNYNVGIIYNAETGGNGLSLIRVNMDNTEIEQPTIGGLVAYSGEGIYAVDCEIIRQKNGVLLNPSNEGYGIHYILFDNCMLDLCSENNFYINGSYKNVYEVKFNDGWLGTGGHGLFVNVNGADIYGISFNENIVVNNDGGLYFSVTSGSLSGITLSGNKIIANSKTTNSSYDGINLNGVISKIIITDNIIDGAVSGYANTHRYGINIGTALNDINISNNIINNTTQSIYGTTSGVMYNSLNIGAPLNKTILIPANDIFEDGGEKTRISGSATPVCINMVTGVISGFGFNYRFDKLTAFNTNANISLIITGTTTMQDAQLHFTIHNGKIVNGSAISDNPIDKNITLDITQNNITEINLGSIAGINPNDFMWINVLRVGNSNDTYTGTVNLIGVKIDYLSV